MAMTSSSGVGTGWAAAPADNTAMAIEVDTVRADMDISSPALDCVYYTSTKNFKSGSQKFFGVNRPASLLYFRLLSQSPQTAHDGSLVGDYDPQPFYDEMFTLDRTPRPHRSEEHTSELQSLTNLVCRLLLEKKKKKIKSQYNTI